MTKYITVNKMTNFKNLIMVVYYMFYLLIYAALTNYHHKNIKILDAS